MIIPAKQIEHLKQRLLFAFGALNVAKIHADKTIRDVRLAEVEEALCDIDDALSGRTGKTSKA
jgi:hypothetical protein